MPSYSYLCPCGAEAELYRSMDCGLPPICPNCKKTMNRDWSKLRFGINTHQLGYDTSDITGSPVHVATLKQERDLCQHYGVRRVSSDEIRAKRKAKIVPDEPLRTAFERKRHQLGVE